MKIISWNVNGVRSVIDKGFFKWFNKEKPDILCLQEIKADAAKLPERLKNLKGCYSYFSHAKKPGYSGVAVFSKIKPKKIENKIGFGKFDSEGRILKLEFSNFILINLYLPHGGRGKEKLGYKLLVYKKLLTHLKKDLRHFKKRPVILIGDFNIAHTEIDLARPRANKNNIMFTSEERKCLDRLLKLGFVDTFRNFHKEGGHYTWWPYMARARERNLGWRIDYLFASENIIKKIRKTFILNKTKWSDHCPLGMEVKL